MLVRVLDLGSRAGPYARAEKLVHPNARPKIGKEGSNSGATLRLNAWLGRARRKLQPNKTAKEGGCTGYEPHVEAPQFDPARPCQ